MPIWVAKMAFTKKMGLFRPRVGNDKPDSNIFFIHFLH
jgi:hypothetical protein